MASTSSIRSRRSVTIEQPTNVNSQTSDDQEEQQPIPSQSETEEENVTYNDDDERSNTDGQEEDAGDGNNEEVNDESTAEDGRESAAKDDTDTQQDDETENDQSTRDEQPSRQSDVVEEAEASVDEQQQHESAEVGEDDDNTAEKDEQQKKGVDIVSVAKGTRSRKSPSPAPPPAVELRTTRSAFKVREQQKTNPKSALKREPQTATSKPQAEQEKQPKVGVLLNTNKNSNQMSDRRMPTRRSLMVISPLPRPIQLQEQAELPSKSHKLYPSEEKVVVSPKTTRTFGKKFSAAAAPAISNELPSSNKAKSSSAGLEDQEYPAWYKILFHYFDIGEPSGGQFGDDSSKQRNATVPMKCMLCDHVNVIKPNDTVSRAVVPGNHLKRHRVLFERLRRYKAVYEQCKVRGLKLPALPPRSDDADDGYDEEMEEDFVTLKRQQSGKKTASNNNSVATGSNNKRQLINGGKRGEAALDDEDGGNMTDESKETPKGLKKMNLTQQQQHQEQTGNLPKTRSFGKSQPPPAKHASPVEKQPVYNSNGMPRRRMGPKPRSALHNAMDDADNDAGGRGGRGESGDRKGKNVVLNNDRKSNGSNTDAMDEEGDTGRDEELEAAKFNVLLEYFEIVAPAAEKLMRQPVGSRCVLRCGECRASLRVLWGDQNGLFQHMQNKHGELLKQVQKYNNLWNNNNKQLDSSYGIEQKRPPKQQQQSIATGSGARGSGKMTQSASNKQQQQQASQRLSPMPTRRSFQPQTESTTAGSGAKNNIKNKFNSMKPNGMQQDDDYETYTPTQQLQTWSGGKKQQPRKYGLGTRTAMSAATIAKADNELLQFVNMQRGGTTDADLKKHLYQAVLFFYTDFRIRRDAVGYTRGGNMVPLGDEITVEKDDLLARSSSPMWNAVQTLVAQAADTETRRQRRKTPLMCACRLCGVPVSIRYSDVSVALEHLKLHHPRLGRCLVRMREVYRRRPKLATSIMSSENLFRLLYFVMFGAADDDVINEQLAEAQQQDGDLVGLRLTPRTSTSVLEELLRSLSSEDAARRNSTQKKGASSRKRSLGTDYETGFGGDEDEDDEDRGGDGDLESLNSGQGDKQQDSADDDDDDEQRAPPPPASQGRTRASNNNIGSKAAAVSHAVSTKMNNNKKQRLSGAREANAAEPRGRGRQMVKTGESGKSSAEQQTQVVMMQPPPSSNAVAEQVQQPPAQQQPNAARLRKQLIVVYYQFSMHQPGTSGTERTIIMLPNLGPSNDPEQLEQTCLPRVVQLIRILEEEGQAMGPGSARYELPTDGITVVDRLLMLGFHVEAQSSANEQIMWTLTTTGPPLLG